MMNNKNNMMGNSKSNMMNSNMHESTLNGVCCDVNNCVHNDSNSGCTASKIQVGPHSASCTNDTVCNSFQNGAS